LAQELGLSITETAEPLERIIRADEVFISSSLKLIIGVSLVREGETDYRLHAGPVTQLLRRHFNRRVFGER
jgi:branched-subunit amino acid aminotransferase/4-amino-4-deoxychorismate lyase